MLPLLHIRQPPSPTRGGRQPSRPRSQRVHTPGSDPVRAGDLGRPARREIGPGLHCCTTYILECGMAALFSAHTASPLRVVQDVLRHRPRRRHRPARLEDACSFTHSSPARPTTQSTRPDPRQSRGVAATRHADLMRRASRATEPDMSAQDDHRLWSCLRRASVRRVFAPTTHRCSRDCPRCRSTVAVAGRASHE